MSSSIVSRPLARILSFSSWLQILVLAVRIITNQGITSSVPNTKECCVCPVELFVVVLSAQRTKGNSSAHLPILYVRIFLNLLTNDLDARFNLSIILRIDKCKSGRLDSPTSTKKNYVLLHINWDPLWHIIFDGMPNLVEMLRLMKDLTSFSLTWIKASSSIHLEK